jgi:hypothetical protein
MDFSTVLIFATGVLAGVIAALKIIAPKTKTTADDKVLEVAEKVEGVVTGLKDLGKPKAG